MYLLDTNIISETIKKKPNPHVLSWLSSIESSKFFLSVLTMGEIRKGIEKLEDLAKKKKNSAMVGRGFSKKILWAYY